tara:strand:+ start:696 stop:1340 length:645 start_codon:yes stop_codon:yes gene_type:complete
MAERPTYQRRGAQLRMPTFQDAVGQVAARGAAQKAQDLGRMTQFFLQQTQQQAEIAGSEYGALHAPTKKQIEDAYKSGGAVNIPGGNLTVFDRAAKQAAYNMASDQLEMLTREKISEIVLGAYQSKMPADDLADKIDEVIAGYAGTFDKDAPTVAVQFRAKMGIYAHNEFEAYSKWKIGQNKNNHLATILAAHQQTDSGDTFENGLTSTSPGGK